MSKWKRKSRAIDYGLDIPSGVAVRNGLIHWYTVYHGDDDGLVVQGTAKMCADYMGKSLANFRSYACRSSGQPFRGWTIFMDLVEPSEVYGEVV